MSNLELKDLQIETSEVTDSSTLAEVKGGTFLRRGFFGGCGFGYGFGFGSNVTVIVNNGRGRGFFI